MPATARTQQTQVAVLMTFPEGVTPERARQIANYWARTALGPSEEPHVVQVREFVPEFGAVCIYQP